jgi:phosphohistidine phosphatase
MEVYFLRHGLAGQHGDPKYMDDSLRPLTKEGREKMKLAARGMHTLGLKFDAIFSSPYLRALETAEIVARSYKIENKKIQLTDTLLPPASITELLREVDTHRPKSKNLLCVGHEPHLTTLVSCLLKSKRPLDIDFKKGGLCCLSIHQPIRQACAVLNWLLTPEQLGLMAKEK